jgi:hypothetical protein
VHSPLVYRRLIRGLLLTLAGCLGTQPTAKHVGVGFQLDEAVRGAEVVTAGEIRGVGLSARAHGEELSRDEPEVPGFVRRNGAIGVDVGLRLSLIGMGTKDLRLARWFDLGAEFGAGGAFVKPSRLETVGRVWAGGWVMLGALPGNPKPSIVLDVRRVANDGWDNYTTFTIGVAYSWRKLDSIDIRD